MSVETIYRVRKPNGELAGEYMDKKRADSHDQKLDCIYTIVDLMMAHSGDLQEDVAEGLAEHLVDNKSVLLSALKKVKDLPSGEADGSSGSKLGDKKHSASDISQDASVAPEQTLEAVTKKAANS